MESNILIDYEKEIYRENIKEENIISWANRIMEISNYKKSRCSILFCSSNTIQELNRRYRDKDEPTDVLSFSQIEGENANYIDEIFLGDIVICFEIAQKQAEEQNHSLIVEILTLILHGILHLIGYDHEQDDGKMLQLQDKIFNKLIGEFI